MKRSLFTNFVVMQLRRILFAIVALLVLDSAVVSQGAGALSFTLEQIRGNPFPTELVASAKGSRLAWVFNERGVRNIWVTEGPDFRARRLTSYAADDGQELFLSLR